MKVRGNYYPWFLQHQQLVKKGNKVKAGKFSTNLQETSTKPNNKAKLSVKFSIQDGAHIINYGFNGTLSYYYLNNDIDSSGKGMVLQLHRCSSSTVKGHQVSVETLAEFSKRYGIRNKHIDKMKQGKSF